MDVAVEGEFLRVLQWLQHHSKGCADNTFDGATQNSEFEVLLYLCSVRQEQFTEEAVVEHDSDENSDVIAWVLDRYPALRTATRKE
ncbi:hypothetical protein PC116_g11613 [Phytophthora cactorum]|nr:hypothetical protein Pcac1_g26049 [Phytophthora cactorum]KAG4240430.1 hypothetical protein PC116_g11613 [Phytophthora cactorum]